MAVLTEIPEPDGRVRRYRITRARRPAGTIRVRGLGAKKDSDYRVSLDERGMWACTCKHFKYRAKPPHLYCKHVDEVRHLIVEGRMMATKKQTKPVGTNCTEKDQVAEAAFAEPPADRPDVDEIAKQLAAPFESAEIKFKAQATSGNRALAVPFVDARVVQDRLDDVLGIFGWQDSYECLPDGSVVCRLKVRIGQEWIVKEDVGGQSEQPDEGDRRKAAFSDALKRAAVKFGVGRFLYRQKPQWVDYDPQKRQFLRQPTLAGTPAPARTPPQSAPADIPDETMTRLYASLIGEMQLDLEKCKARLRKMYGVDDFKKLTKAQAESVLDALAKELEKRKATR